MKTKGLSARTAMMATGALVVFFTGFIHVWSIFLPYVTKLTGWTESQTSLVFYLANALFVLGKFYLIVIAMTCGLIPYFLVGSLSSPVISSFLRGAGTGWRGVFAFGALCSLIAFVCLLALKKSFGKGQEDIRNHGR